MIVFIANARLPSDRRIVTEFLNSNDGYYDELDGDFEFTRDLDGESREVGTAGDGNVVVNDFEPRRVGTRSAAFQKFRNFLAAFFSIPLMFAPPGSKRLFVLNALAMVICLQFGMMTADLFLRVLGFLSAIYLFYIQN